MEPTETKWITVYGLGSGLSERYAGPLARQATEALAEGLSGFAGLLGRAHYLLEEGEGLDGTLLGLTGEPSMSSRFVLMSSTPSGSMLRALTQEQGGHLALTGRLDPGREEVWLSLNLWDTRSPMTLWWCRAERFERELLPARLGELLGALAWSLGAAGSLEEALTRGAALVGTRDMGAWESWASAADRLRQRALGQGDGEDAEILRSLCQALSRDPGFGAARGLLLEQAMVSLGQGDERAAEALLRGLGELEEGDIEGLLRVEALLCLRRGDEALRAAQALARARPDDPAAQAALGRAQRFT